MTRLGRYEIEREIGRGTMGVVYLALDPRLKRRVALKVWTLPQGLGDEQQQEAQRRFVREAQAAAGLAHPGIVTVFDVDRDEASDRLYIAMEHVEGATLDRLLASEGPPSLERAVEIVSTVADALGAAHQAGIVHRDVKPANVLVRDADGAVKLADFGVARIDSSSLTQPGTSIGSPAYMSPEQARGRELDGRSDLFSLASILYELLTGRRAFPGDEPTAVMYSVIHEPVQPPSVFRPDLPPGIDVFFERALSKDAADRYADARQYRQALDRARQQPESVTESAAPRLGDDSGETTAVDESGETVAIGDDSRTDDPSHSPDRSGETVAVDRSGETAAVDRSGETVAIEAEVQSESVHRGARAVAASGSNQTIAIETSHETVDVGSSSPASGSGSSVELPSRAREAHGPTPRLRRWRTVLSIAAMLLLAILAVKIGRSVLSDPAVLALEGRSNNVAGVLEITVDGDEVYERELTATTNRRLLRRIVRNQTESFEASIEVGAGRHEIVATLTEQDGEVHRDVVSLELEPGETRALSVRAGRLFGSPVSIRAD